MSRFYEGEIFLRICILFSIILFLKIGHSANVLSTTGGNVKNSTSKESLAHLHNVMILLLRLDLITSVQRMREGGSLSSWLPLSLSLPSPLLLTGFFFVCFIFGL